MTDPVRKTPAPSPLAEPLSEAIFAGRDAETALDTPSKVRCALTRLARLTADGLISTKVANSVAFVIGLAAKQNELELAAELAHRLAELQADPRSSTPWIRDSIDAVLEHMPTINGAVARAEVAP
jgi:hypothetical protein